MAGEGQRKQEMKRTKAVGGVAKRNGERESAVRGKVAAQREQAGVSDNGCRHENGAVHVLEDKGGLRASG